MRVGNLSSDLEELRDILAVARHEFSILEKTARELTSIVALCDGPGADALIRRNLVELDRRLGAALERQKRLVRALEECRRDLRCGALAGTETSPLH
jgi:hypothetical protein